MFSFKKYAFAVSLVAAFMLGCGGDIPIKEMAEAKKAITRAAGIKADKYAQAEFEAAGKKLYECHDLIKKEDYSKAKDAALDSKKKADEAYNKAIPLLAKDTIAIAEKSLEDAKEVYAEKLAKDEYDSASDQLKNANTSYTAAKYYDSYIAALDADKKAKNARNMALSKKDMLKDAISEVKLTLNEARKYGGDKYAPEKFKLAEENIKTAENANTNMKLREGFSAVEVAKINADEALLAGLEATAKEKVSMAEASIEKAEKSQGASGAKDELAAAKESLANAKASLAAGKFAESINYSDDAIKYATIVSASKKGSVVATGKEPVKTDGDGEDKDFILYTVKDRKPYTDCLWTISYTYYKNPRLWTKIFKANKDKIKNPDVILPGWVIKIPKLQKN